MSAQKIVVHHVSGEEYLYVADNDTAIVAVDLVIYVYDTNPFPRQHVRVTTTSSDQYRLMTSNVSTIKYFPAIDLSLI